jgi:hypothetical protein
MVTHSRSAFAAIAVVTAGLLSACGGDDKGSSVAATATKPATTEAPPPGQLKTTVGALQVSKVTSPRQYQGNVPSSASLRLMVITLRPAAGETVSAGSDAFDAAAKRTEVRNSKGGSGRPAITSVQTSTGKPPKFALVFTVKASGRAHKLHWPGNPPLDLEQFR